MATTDFIQFNPAAINQESDAQYLADSQRAGGYGVNNTVPSPLLNKFSYQTSTFCAAFCQMMAAKGYSTSDADVNVLAAVLANVITDADLEPNVMVVGYSPTPAFNAADANGFQMTLAGNITASSIAGVSPGQLIAFYFAQDATGGRTVSWPSGFVGALQPDPAANAVSVQIFRADLSSVPRAVTAMVSNNGTFTNSISSNGAITATGQLTGSSLTLSAGAPAGYTLIGNGTIFASVAPSFLSSQNGYLKDVASGIIFQWGTVMSGTGSSHIDQSFTFPVLFPNAVLNCTATANSDAPTGGWGVIVTMVKAKSQSGATISVDTTQTSIGFSNSVPVCWFAVGY